MQMTHIAGKIDWLYNWDNVRPYIVSAASYKASSFVFRKDKAPMVGDTFLKDNSKFVVCKAVDCGENKVEIFLKEIICKTL